MGIVKVSLIVGNNALFGRGLRVRESPAEFIDNGADIEDIRQREKWVCRAGGITLKAQHTVAGAHELLFNILGKT